MLDERGGDPMYYGRADIDVKDKVFYVRGSLPKDGNFKIPLPPTSLEPEPTWLADGTELWLGVEVVDADFLQFAAEGDYVSTDSATSLWMRWASTGMTSK